MGASVGAAARAAGHRVLWCPDGRSEASVERATRAGLTGCSSLAELAGESDVIISVCPPAAAVDLAKSVVDAGFVGTYVDANAVSPATAGEVEAVLASPDIRVVDGGIVGPPAWTEGTTRLFLSGPGSCDVAALFECSPLGVVDLAGTIGEASALKMGYAAWTKGSSALLAAVASFAEAAGVSRPLAEEWDRSQPGLNLRLERTLASVAPKAWRFFGEMHEIADSFAAVGQPEGYHRAAAATYEDMLDPQE